MFSGIWTGIFFLVTVFLVFVWQGQGIAIQGENAILSIPDLSFRTLAKAIDVAVLLAVTWEVSADMLARITRDKAKEAGRKEAINELINQWKAQGVPDSEIMVRLGVSKLGKNEIDMVGHQ